MIQIENVQLTLSKKQILSDINLSVAEGRRLAIVGLSGSGKSTLLKCICGLIKIDSGRIVIDDVEMNGSNLFLIRKKIGYVSQGNGLYPHLTVLQNIKLANECKSRTANKFIEEVEFMFELTNLPLELLARYPRELSGGQSQRVEIVRALISNPKILLMDEPTSALDVLTKRKFQRDLKPILDRFNTTLILVSHDIEEANYFSENIIVMNEGKIVQIGTLKELKASPKTDLVREITC